MSHRCKTDSASLRSESKMNLIQIFKTKFSFFNLAQKKTIRRVLSWPFLYIRPVYLVVCVTYYRYYYTYAILYLNFSFGPKQLPQGHITLFRYG